MKKQQQMTRSTKTQTNSKPIWKQGEGWVQYKPSRSHPFYEEWEKLLEKEKEDNERDTN